MLPDALLARRVDTVAVIGAALAGAATGTGHRPVAEAVGRPVSTVRGWLRRFRAGAERIVRHFRAWALRLDPMFDTVAPAGSPLADAVEAIGWRAAPRRCASGARPGWSWASVLSVGRLLANTNSPWLAP